MPTLVLLRHAKTEPQGTDDSRSDHSRRLTPQGRADAELVRRWLADQGLVPGRVVVSTAVRARETWELASVGDVPAEHDERLYEATPADLREVVAETGADVTTLVLVGHNPTFERLAWELDDSDSARERTNSGMGTCGVAVFELDDWDAEDGRLVAFR
jgi:phosphohistidine phosphatase